MGGCGTSRSRCRWLRVAVIATSTSSLITEANAQVAESCASSGKQSKLDVGSLNPLVINAEYAVRGRLLDRAMELEKDLSAGKPLPFDQIVRCNIGNPQALGQKPITFGRQTLSLLVNPSLLASVRDLYPADVIERAERYIAATPSVGAYSDSQGVRLVREEVAEFIAERDGYPASADDIFLTDGASAGVKAVMQLLIRGKDDAVLAPVPQYPLYSAATTLLNGTLGAYYLDEAASWGVQEAELLRALEAVRARGATPRALVVINPGNPTGQSMPVESVEATLALAAREGLVLMADEVYQENVYGDAPPFTSFKRALSRLKERGEAGDEAAAALAAKLQLVSFHSTSKGFFGECGLRGGYFELQGFPADVKAQLIKLASISLCSNVPGQFATGLMVRPPKKGQPSYDNYVAERAAILTSLESRAVRLAGALNALPGVRCNPAEGAMYLFPNIALPPAAIAAAAQQGMAADEFYCIKLLEATGLVVVPGSGFDQVKGTFHFRTTFLPSAEVLEAVLGKLSKFQEEFMSRYA